MSRSLHDIYTLCHHPPNIFYVALVLKCLFFQGVDEAVCCMWASLMCAAQMAARTNSREAYKSYSNAITEANTRVTLRCSTLNDNNGVMMFLLTLLELDSSFILKLV